MIGLPSSNGILQKRIELELTNDSIHRNNNEFFFTKNRSVSIDITRLTLVFDSLDYWAKRVIHFFNYLGVVYVNHQTSSDDVLQKKIDLKLTNLHNFGNQTHFLKSSSIGSARR